MMVQHNWIRNLLFYIIASSIILPSVAQHDELITYSSGNTADDTLIVGTLDGTVYGLNPNTGGIQWSFSSGKSLSSSSHPPIIPSVDGSLYFFTVDGLQRYPQKVEEIVNHSPFSFSEDASVIFVGSKTTSLYVISSKTGEVQKCFGDGNNIRLEDDDGDFSTSSSSCETPQDAIYLGRVDYTIKAIDVNSHQERWNVTLGQYVSSYYSHNRQKINTKDSFVLVSATNGMLKMIERSSGDVIWTSKLQSPAVHHHNQKDRQSSEFPSIAGLYFEEQVLMSGKDVLVAEYEGSFFALPSLPQQLPSSISVSHISDNYHLLPSPREQWILDLKSKHNNNNHGRNKYPHQPSIGDKSTGVVQYVGGSCNPMSSLYPYCLIGIHANVLPQTCVPEEYKQTWEYISTIWTEYISSFFYQDENTTTMDGSDRTEIEEYFGFKFQWISLLRLTCSYLFFTSFTASVVVPVFLIVNFVLGISILNKKSSSASTSTNTHSSPSSKPNNTNNNNGKKNTNNKNEEVNKSQTVNSNLVDTTTEVVNNNNSDNNTVNGEKGEPAMNNSPTTNKNKNKKKKNKNKQVKDTNKPQTPDVEVDVVGDDEETNVVDTLPTIPETNKGTEKPSENDIEKDNKSNQQQKKDNNSTFTDYDNKSEETNNTNNNNKGTNSNNSKGSKGSKGKKPNSNNKSNGSNGSSSDAVEVYVDEDGTLRVGQIRIFQDKILGYGSHGTVVYLGTFHNRQVAVKRMLLDFYDQKEVDLLIESDEHSSVVRYYSKEQDSQFVYIALTYCSQTLYDLVQDDELYKTLKKSNIKNLLSQLSNGIKYLHSLNIVHRDIKPQNILLTQDLKVKISDMGLAKKLSNDKNSFSSTCPGTIGWQAPEILKQNLGSMTNKVDVFAFGCIIHYVITGKHPYGEQYERQINIINGEPVDNLSEIRNLDPLAYDLVSKTLVSDPSSRISMTTVCLHPFFWDSHKKLEFLRDLSDFLEFEKPNSEVVLQFESFTSHVVKRKLSSDNTTSEVSDVADWKCCLHEELLKDLNRYRKYDVSKVRDLLRVIRNKAHHYRDLPTSLQQELGKMPSGFVKYFTKLFPDLLSSTYNFVQIHPKLLTDQATFEKYVNFDNK
eukprot:TRINITY_DN1338_c3_g2_i1.p1 TRINITY_DN1338_c3_g2~~TRINITY_DN1338_c3_g2_i1.p1  ORF type:complete len:1112 (-),score=237.63 TRINITY_DN1338_c3_g2_i1:92-3427(-)